MSISASRSPRGFRSSSSSVNRLSSIPESEPFLENGDADVEMGVINHGHRNKSIPHTGDANEEDSDTSETTSIFSGYPKRHRLWRLLGLSAASLGIRSKNSRRCLGRTKSVRNTGRRKPSVPKRILGLLVVLLMLLGFIQVVGILIGLSSVFFPNQVDRTFAKLQGKPLYDPAQWPTDATSDVTAVRCHSHNDYWRQIPLKSAIHAGCTSVEADVWLYGGDLYVGHSEAALSSDRTLSSLYVNPLLELLEQQNPITEFHSALDIPRNGVFDTASTETLVLLIDFKTDGEKLWQVVSSQLEPLRSKQYLTHFNGSALNTGPITVVVTGNAPFNRVIANTTYRDMFFDAPLSEMGSLPSEPSATLPLTYDPAEEQSYLKSISTEEVRNAVDGDKQDINKGQGYSGHAPQSPTIYSPFNSYYASTSLQVSVGIPFPYITAVQRTKLQQQIAGAHSLGLQVRYWDTPAWPISWRNYIWRELVQMGVDYLNVDDLESATKGDWRSKGGLGRAFWGMGGW